MTDLRKAAEKAQPEALRLADLVDDPTLAKYHEHKNIAAELRRLHEENQALRQALAKPEWVGLTDEERFKIARDTRPYVADTMRAHEEELKRRNT